jgi:hypothetical protein
MISMRLSIAPFLNIPWLACRLSSSETLKLPWPVILFIGEAGRLLGPLDDFKNGLVVSAGPVLRPFVGDEIVKLPKLTSIDVDVENVPRDVPVTERDRVGVLYIPAIPKQRIEKQKSVGGVSIRLILQLRGHVINTCQKFPQTEAKYNP